MQQPDYIVFLCYGNESIFHECAFSLLSLTRLYNNDELRNIQVCIYTDNPGWFQSFKDCPLSLTYRTLEADTLKRWKGAINFVHRVKIEILKDFTTSHSGNVLYVDTDAVFMQRLDPVFQNISVGQLYMHVMEAVVSSKSNPILTKLFYHLRGNPLKINGRSLCDLAMWNAGVLGFNSRYSDLLDEILSFTDVEYAKFPKHIVEQFAFSIFFQRTGEIKAASTYILHYWNLKEARQLLASFFAHFKNASWKELARYSQLIQMHVLMQEKVNFLHNRTIIEKLQKKRWSPAQPNWEQAIKQL